MKNTYRVLVQETFKCYVDVEAKTKAEAIRMVEKGVQAEALIAPRDFDDFTRSVRVVCPVQIERAPD